MHTATSLQLLGMKGEGVTDDRVWVIKSHHPLKIPQSAEFKSSKTVVCIRNPLDVLISYANCLNTFSHDNKLAFDVNDKFPEWWSSFVKAETIRMKQFLEKLRRDCDSQTGANPLYVVRYEDLELKPKETVMGLFAFLLGVLDLGGTNTERRID